jgi:PhoH-like ATPase
LGGYTLSQKTTVRKRFVIDTNVILFDPQAIFKFQDGDVIIPISVIEEMDRFKKDLGENGRNARQFSRFVDVLRAKGALSKGVLLEKSHSYFFVNLDNHTDVLPAHLDSGKTDNRILALAMKLQKEKPPRPTVVITKDTNLRIKADVLGLIAEDYEPQKVDIEDLFSGITEFEVSSDAIDSFYAQKSMPISDPNITPNQYILFKDITNPNHSAIARYNAATKSAVPLIKPSDNVWGIYPRNVEQSFALDCLLNDDIKLVSLVGKAGTGKTLLALAAGLSKTLDDGKYHRLLVSRPIFPMGRDIGYLPGDVEEKLNPWMQPVFDNIEYLLGAGTTHRRAAGRAQELISQGMLNIEPLTYIRGRSIPNQYLIVDEAQNLTPHEIKTIITRAGQGTKVVLTGDCWQIDNPYVDSANNGLTYVVERFKGEPIAAHVTLSKGERSELAEVAANLL